MTAWSVWLVQPVAVRNNPTGTGDDRLGRAPEGATLGIAVHDAVKVSVWPNDGAVGGRALPVRPLKTRATSVD